MALLIITDRSREWSDGMHREDGHFNPETISLEEAIETCLANDDPYTEITLQKNDEQHTEIAHLEYEDGELKSSTKPLTDELKNIKVKFYCRIGGWRRMHYMITQVSSDTEDLVGFVTIQELEGRG